MFAGSMRRDGLAVACMGIDGQPLSLAHGEGEVGEQPDQLPSEYRVKRRSDMENTKNVRMRGLTPFASFSFGEMLVESYSAGLGTAVASFRFSTKYFDAELKPLYYGYP